MTTPFWLSDPNILFKHDKITEIWPVKRMSFTEKLNAITRLIIVLTIVGMCFENRLHIGITGIITILCIAMLYHFKKNDTKKEGLVNRKPPEYSGPRTAPTVENPVMNVLLTERKDNPDRPPAEKSFEPEVEEKINNDTQKFIAKNFGDPEITEKLFQDLGDKFTFDRSMRQWYSTPNTQIPSDQKSFAEWCYGDMISCKEGNENACTKGTPHRHVGT